MLAASRSLGIGIVVTLSLFIYFQEISFSHLRSAASTQSVDADNAAVLDIGKTIIDVAHKEGPRFRQATVVNVYDQKSSYERILKTHVDHGKKWGYPTHVLWQDNVGNGVNDEDVLNKTSYLQSILNVEMAKPVEERSQWIV